MIFVASKRRLIKFKLHTDKEKLRKNFLLYTRLSNRLQLSVDKNQHDQVTSLSLCLSYESQRTFQEFYQHSKTLHFQLLIYGFNAHESSTFFYIFYRESLAVQSQSYNYFEVIYKDVSRCIGPSPIILND